MWCSGNIVDLYSGHQQSFGFCGAVINSVNFYFGCQQSFSFCGFPQQHKTDATTAPQLGHDHFLPHPFLFIDHAIIKYHPVCNAEILVK
jgi:hypothetical protein